MSYYVLKVEQPGPRSYVQSVAAKRMIEAKSLADAKEQADDIVDEDFGGGRRDTMLLYDESGLVATRVGQGEWIG